MLETRMAKLIKNETSQTVQLPDEFCFDSNEVYMTHDDTTGEVVLSSRPGIKTWRDFFDLIHSMNTPDDFMAERPMNVPPQERSLLSGED